MINPQLKDRVALVTGANHGIGAAIARALAAQGVHVFITYKIVETDNSIPDDSAYTQNRKQDASRVLSAITDAGGSAQAAELDLSQPEQIPRLFDLAEAAFGPVDIVVNNAAHWTPATFVPPDAPEADSTALPFAPELHDAAFAVNARATAHIMSEFARRHHARGATRGRIINISTDAAYSFPRETTYGASKLAMESYSRSAASELGQFGITVNIVSPGPVQTGYITDEDVKNIAAHTPLRRIGYPDDVADVVVFLASDQARWLTGQVLYVGGGHRM